MARPRKTECIRGHALTEENRTKAGCRTCGQLRENVRRSAGGRVIRSSRAVGPRAEQAPDAPHRLPVAPLRRLVELHGGMNAASIVFAARTGRSVAASARWLHRLFASESCSVYEADTAAVGLGRHPFEIYGDAWISDLLEEGATTHVA